MQKLPLITAMENDRANTNRTKVELISVWGTLFEMQLLRRQPLNCGQRYFPQTVTVIDLSLSSVAGATLLAEASS